MHLCLLSEQFSENERQNPVCAEYLSQTTVEKITVKTHTEEDTDYMQTETFWQKQKGVKRENLHEREERVQQWQKMNIPTGGLLLE